MATAIERVVPAPESSSISPPEESRGDGVRRKIEHSRSPEGKVPKLASCGDYDDIVARRGTYGKDP